MICSNKVFVFAVQCKLHRAATNASDVRGAGNQRGLDIPGARRALQRPWGRRRRQVVWLRRRRYWWRWSSGDDHRAAVVAARGGGRQGPSEPVPDPRRGATQVPRPRGGRDPRCTRRRRRCTRSCGRSCAGRVGPGAGPWRSRR
jgi:hypothetical protein